MSLGGERTIAFSFGTSLVMVCVLLFVVLPISHTIKTVCVCRFAAAHFAELNVHELLNTIFGRINIGAYFAFYSKTFTILTPQQT